MDIKTLCLGVLTLGDMTGYDIKKHFEQAFRHFFVAGFGSIYPALAELAGEGLVTVTDVPQPGRPDKKVYSIAGHGRAVLAEALLRTPARHRVRSEFLVLLYFADLLPHGRLAEVLDERSTEIRGLLAALDAHENEPHLPAHHAFVVGFGRATLEAQLRYIEAHRHELLAGCGPSEPDPRPEPLMDALAGEPGGP